MLYIATAILLLQILLVFLVCKKNSAKAKDMASDKDDRNQAFSNLTNIIIQQLQAVNQNTNTSINSINVQLLEMIKFNELQINNMKDFVGRQLENIRADNNKQLEEIRATVDEKLQATLEKRLNESFKMVSEQLEVVHKSVGEMRNIASDVGGLKKVLANVKTRGIWGEVQLSNIITQLLSEDQYGENVAVVANSNNRVEFAIKLPGKDNAQRPVWLPIDAKFPLDVYQKLVNAYELGNSDDIKEQSKSLVKATQQSAALIASKYIAEPYTTDFAIMFLPIEGLYAEIVKTPGLIEQLQQEYRVIITSPTTFSAIINSLQLGFKTLAIEKRSSELWRILGGVKTEFLRFSDILNKTKLKLDQASKAIGDAEVRTRKIQKHLLDVPEEAADSHKKLK